jgi:HD-GYP domain-containing protein (c-di-GMP phosphodiesterase class II)
MSTERLKIDLTFIGPDSMVIYPLYSIKGEKIVEARTPLSPDRINKIIEQHGKIVYYSFSEEMGNIPNHRINAALHKSAEIMEEVVKTDKISKASYRESEEIVEGLLSDLVSSETDTIRLIKDLNSYDDYTYNHSVNVLLLTSVFSHKLNRFSKNAMKSLLVGAFLHDVGKMKLDKQLLNKKGKLDVNEFQKMKRHPQQGYEMIKNVDAANHIVQQSILFHHEKYNGKGYYELPYENLPIYPKIISICDVFDALTSRRPYREASSPSEAIKQILNSVNSHFDYELINNFINLIGPLVNNTSHFYGRYEVAELNTHELALIIELGKPNILKPQVVVFARFEKVKSKINIKFYDKPFRVNLEEDVHRMMINILSNEYQVNSLKNKLLEKSLLKIDGSDPFLIDRENRKIQPYY